MSRFNKIVLMGIIFSFISCNNAYAHEDELEFFHPIKITNGQKISLSDCISAAYQNSPKIKRQKYNLDIANSNLGIARAGYFPVLAAGVGFYNETNSDSIYYDRHYRDLPSVGVSINKMVWDFGKTTANIKMEKFYKIGAEYEFMDSLCATLFDIKWKYYQLLKAKALFDIEKENVRLVEEIKTMTSKTPDKETTSAYLSMANVRYLEAEDNFYKAKTDLDNAMYLLTPTNYSIQNTETFNYTLNVSDSKFIPHDFPFKKEDAYKIALKNSPDLHVLIATREAMKQSLLYIKRSFLPELNANVGYGYNHNFESSNNSLRVGATLDSSVNLMELKHSIKGADAQINLAQTEIDLFKKDLFFDIKRGFYRTDKAKNQVPHAQEELAHALKAYSIVKDKYRTGELDYTSFHDAREDLIQANKDYVEALYEYNIGLIQIEMAMHCHIVDIHHKSGHAIHHHSDQLINNLVKALDCKKSDSGQDSLLFGENDDFEIDESL